MNIDPVYHTKLLELRSMKDFAAICQFLHMFHPAFALDDFETEDLEQALVDPSSIAYLIDLQARMLRALTQDRRISFDNWFKYAQKEFEKRAEDQNPWLDEDAYNYESFSLATKLMILTNLCEWQLDDPERFRAHFKEEEEVAVEWTFCCRASDNRLYRENPPPKKNVKTSKQPAPSSKVKPTPAARRGTRRSTRGQKVEDSPEPEEEEFETPPITPGVEWEPVCITQHEWEEFANLFRRSKHPDEKALHVLINHDILPKVLGDFKEKEKEREKLEAIANRKRSSRIVIRELELQEKARLETIRQQELHVAAEQRRQEMRERRAERERISQQQIRDRRLKEREIRLKARENAIWEREEQKKRQLLRIAKEREERKQKRLAGGHADDHSEDEADHDNDEEEEDWFFDCVCGVNGNNLDDGELMIACGKCNVWQHVACLKQEDAEQGRSAKDWETVDFTCARCIAKEHEKELKKAARKEKKEQKLRMEAMAGGNIESNSATLGTKKEPKRKSITQQHSQFNGSQAPLVNGHYPHLPTPPNTVQAPVSHPSSHSHSTAYPAQQYHSQTLPQPYPNPTPYQPGTGIIRAPQTHYNGHPAGYPGPAPPHYSYQQQHPQHQPVHYIQQPSQQQSDYHQPMQQQHQQAHAITHYGSHNASQQYPGYSTAVQQHGGYNSLPPTSSYPGNAAMSYPAQQQYKTESYHLPSPGVFASGPRAASGMIMKRPVEEDLEEMERSSKRLNNHH
ncbi:hypothetical protein BGX28_002445 [Mortierella sp. GBA30]|nr:hypothetical protein BGX28_002445 [Mortierella sp. GBA30]